ncbi:MAG: protein translocase subunit SecF [Propionibacteriaceae bacterium]|jgi:preprotein translocase subunit SecF|nr:protein translocase subunit SecF [Propionibacteriaceae bacterium]
MATTTIAPKTPAKPAAPQKKAGLAHKLFTGQVSYDFVGNRKIWFTFSAVVILLCLAGLVVRGLELGIDFKGGSKFQVNVAAVTDDTVGLYRDAVENAGVADLGNVTVTTVGTSKVSIETRSLDANEQIAVRTAIGNEAGVASEDVAYDQIGASWGSQVTQKGAIALVVFLVVVSLLIGIYFRHWKMALSAILCLFHDMIVTVGVYAWVGFEVTPSTLTGVLTILGYSLYDTVVVFDKVRENWANLEESRLTYSEAANLADNQVLMRSINTTILGVLPVAALLVAGSFVLGSGPLEDIGLALFVGMIAGAYSSIFIATPLLAWLKDLEPAVKEHTAKVLRRRGKAKRIQVTETAAPKAAASGASPDEAVTVVDIVAEQADNAAEGEPAEADVLAAAAPAKPAARRQPSHQPRSQRKKK